MKNIIQFFLNNPILLVAAAILVIALVIALIKKVMKAAVIISVIIVILGVVFYAVRDKLGPEATKPVEGLLKEGNSAVEKTSPTTFEKAKELGTDEKTTKAAPVKKAGDERKAAAKKPDSHTKNKKTVTGR